MFCYLPENFFSDFIESISDILKVHPREHRAFSNEVILRIYEYCIALLRTDSKSITNPYTKAKALELMTTFIYSDRKKELNNEFGKSEIICKFLMETTIAFYVDIEFAG